MMGRAHFLCRKRQYTVKIKEVIVIEGKSDRNKIIEAVQADTIETNGSAINEHTLKQIKHAQEKRGVIIFTDPDYQGERIRHIIDDAIPGCKHAFLTKKEARSKRKNDSLGIEHATVDDIRKALENVYEVAPEPTKQEMSKSDLISLGLIAGKQAKKRRHRLGELLHIGETNGKQLLHRLRMFNISEEEFARAMKQVIEEEEV